MSGDQFLLKICYVGNDFCTLNSEINFLSIKMWIFVEVLFLYSWKLTNVKIEEILFPDFKSGMCFML